mmetsp:Transcript_106840/g.344698  ORF Transcript_106840/g.344698 Transcript_106840/m.344698 type:complete len:220 (-) Transcript_106840:400-1059(-)
MSGAIVDQVDFGRHRNRAVQTCIETDRQALPFRAHTGRQVGSHVGICTRCWWPDGNLYNVQHIVSSDVRSGDRLAGGAEVGARAHALHTDADEVAGHWGKMSVERWALAYDDEVDAHCGLARSYELRAENNRAAVRLRDGYFELHPLLLAPQARRKVRVLKLLLHHELQMFVRALDRIPVSTKPHHAVARHNQQLRRDQPLVHNLPLPVRLRLSQSPGI